jgi:vacuolar-type H+-ATPase subunit E/Vma4
MALKDIESLVLGKANNEAEEILASARAQAETRLQQAEEDLKREHEHSLANCKDRLENELEQQIASAAANHNRQLLQQKNEILARILEKGRQAILSRPRESYSRWLGSQVRRAAQTPDAIISANPQDHQIVREEIERAGLAVRLAEPDESIAAGIRAAGKEFDLDLTAETVLQEVWQGLLPEFSRQLFSSVKQEEGK